MSIYSVNLTTLPIKVKEPLEDLINFIKVTPHTDIMKNGTFETLLFKVAAQEKHFQDIAPAGHKSWEDYYQTTQK